MNEQTVRPNGGFKGQRERTEASNFTTGYDGKEFWLEADTSYKGNPVFYHNLMFYLYATPFVLADDGIVYSETDTLFFAGKKHSGIKISYEANVGISPEGKYFIYYDDATFEMASWDIPSLFLTRKKARKFTGSGTMAEKK